MSCCPSVPAIRVGAVGDYPSNMVEDVMQSGDSTECYTATAANPTGKHDDATDNVPNKIETPTISVDANGKVNVTFKLQIGSDRTPTSWTMVDTATGNAWSRTDVVFTPSAATFVGTFPQSDFGTKFKVLVTALDATGEIDSRTYVFSPAKATDSNSIRLQHPLPGAIITSRFDPNRKHPVTGVVKAHKGCDFAFSGGKTAAVLSACDGEVIFTGFEDGGAGNYIKIKHSDTTGRHICTTVYMHLREIYVQVGQKVPAGQKIGFEGNTGIGTGAHLHFEVRLPNDGRVDPAPLIQGGVVQARTTNADNTAGSTTETVSGDGVLTAENVAAKTSGCAKYGSEYPNTTKGAANQPVAAPTGNAATDPFEAAWDLTLRTEVVGWGSTPPTDAATLAGTIETSEQKRKCGFVDHPADPGGVTKFGVAQRFNRSVDVKSCDYATARNIAYTNFWNGKTPASLATAGKKKTSIAYFNISYLCGAGGASTIASRAQISSLSDDAALNAMCDQMKIYLQQKIIEDPKKKAFEKGWMARVETVRSYCKQFTG